MDPVNVLPFRPYEQRKLHRLKRQLTNAVNSRRARVVLLSRGGFPNHEIVAVWGSRPSWSGP